jgi:hypothetical protein
MYINIAPTHIVSVPVIRRVSRQHHYQRPKNAPPTRFLRTRFKAGNCISEPGTRALRGNFLEKKAVDEAHRFPALYTRSIVILGTSHSMWYLCPQRSCLRQRKDELESTTSIYRLTGFCPRWAAAPTTYTGGARHSRKKENNFFAFLKMTH